VSIDARFAERIAKFPAALRELIDAELAAGNRIVDVSSIFPAPPIGACAKLARKVSTRPRTSGGGLTFRARNTSLQSGEFTDAEQTFFVLEPPDAPPSEPDMDAIRNRRVQRGANTASAPTTGFAAVDRFIASMRIDYEKWHDGIGYDVDLLKSASPDERARIESHLLRHGVHDWRDVEALAALVAFDSEPARTALQRVAKGHDRKLRLAVNDHAPQLLTEAERAENLVAALERDDWLSGLSRAIDQSATFHPPAVVDALLRGVVARKGEFATHFAALVAYVHGVAKAPYDFDQRAAWLEFNTDDGAMRERLFRWLFSKIGVDPEKYLRG